MSVGSCTVSESKTNECSLVQEIAFWVLHYNDPPLELDLKLV